eukprot:TRINITY_DN9960_c0_g1_i1.p1 TRINITY_DN9960_c0_g1~~TRINITY_DN9960_c0_g1_i1.p1  ORF type:complete len:249 (-),score=34.72 TRINITY_DN9960_c0_g1_i1:116-772(-)
MSATNYSFDFQVTSELLSTMNNTSTLITATKPTGNNTTSTVWISLGPGDVAANATVTVTWSAQYYMLFEDIPFAQGSTVVTVTNNEPTSLGPAQPSAWTYQNPQGFQAVPNKPSLQGSAQVTYNNPSNPGHAVTMGFGVETTTNGVTKTLPLGAIGSQDGFTSTFTPHEVVHIGLTVFQPGLAIDITNTGRIFTFTAAPNSVNHLAWNSATNSFGNAP